MISNPGMSGKAARPSSAGRYADTMESPSTFDSVAYGVTEAIEAAAMRTPRALSLWSESLSKRLFDIGCVVFSFPITLPVLIFTAIAVRLTSRGPVLFKQERMGRHGHAFTIYKFRTMPVRPSSSDRPIVTTAVNQRFTPVGPFLRRWKLDELPQLLNVLKGDMSLVGPRPKVPSHQAIRLNCRPGITGRATVVFAREEVALAHVPLAQLDAYYHDVVLPLKQILDDDYMAGATFASDLKLLAQSVVRKWDDLTLSDVLPTAAFSARSRSAVVRLNVAHQTTVLLPSQKAMASQTDQL